MPSLSTDLDTARARAPLEFATRTLSPLERLSGADTAEIVAEIRGTEFSPYLEQWIKTYQGVGHRGRFLWQWCLKGVRLTTLPSVPPELREHVIETKMLS